MQNLLVSEMEREVKTFPFSDAIQFSFQYHAAEKWWDSTLLVSWKGGLKRNFLWLL
jgi:hypothetical protein